MKTRIFDKEYFEKIGSPPKLEKYLGKEYISYSYLNSFITRREQWITSYLMDERLENIWANYGNEVGDFLQGGEHLDLPLLNQETKRALKPYIFNSKYEFEKPVGFMIGEYLMIGFIDAYKETELIDIKTGSEKTLVQYGEEDYKQTKIYTYGLLDMGYPLPDFIGVLGFYRKGNNTFKHPLRIEGAPIKIEHKYDKKEIEDYIEGVYKPAISEIEEYRNIYLKLENITCS